MNESNEIHRDIYVGMVAEKMAQSGYYGEDVTLYGFLANGELHSFDDEQECAETYLLALAAGAEISRMTSMHKRCQKKRSAKKAAREELASEMRTMLAAEPAPFARRTVDLRALSDYTKGLAKPRSRDQEATLTIGQLSAGSAFNVIPETAVMQGTLRVFDNELRVQLIRRIGEVVENIAVAYRTKVEFEILGDIPALICDAAFNARLAESVQQAAPALAVHGGVHTTGSEDFAFFAPHVPTAMFFIGAETDDGTPTYNQHNPSVRFNDKALPIAAAVYAISALSWQREQA